MAEPVSFRCRKACLTPADLTAFSNLLMENFPTARYFLRPPLQSREPDADHPEVPVADRFLDLPGADLYMTFDADWRPQWRRAGYYQSWSLIYPRLPDVRFDIGRMRPADDQRPEHIQTTDIQCSCRPDHKEDFTMARRLFTLLGKVATNRNHVYVGYPGYEVVTVFEKGGTRWLGHDAIRWAREDSRRLLTMHPSGRGGLRPMET